ncbi:40S ribosomal protein S6 [Paramarasmius palmivorus]|uniref:40S ribosomal protein S6 n=1 Tax=Paramarasmius palmivorus TaxID=297713 RepID=A0AAW0CUD4_9AGAR
MFNLPKGPVQESASQLVDSASCACESKGYLVVGLLVCITSIATVVAWPCLRSRFPCVSSSELNAKEARLGGIYHDALRTAVLHGSALEDITHRWMWYVCPLDSKTMFADAFQHVSLNFKASQIRSMSLSMDAELSPLWKTYIGLHLKLVPEFVAWYQEADVLERELQFNIESDKQLRCRMEFHRRIHGLVGFSNPASAGLPAPITRHADV